MARAASDREADLALAVLVGRALVRLDLPKHAEHCRKFYANVRAGRTPAANEWNRDHVVHLARMLRLPGYETDLPVKPHGSGCRCGSVLRRSTTYLLRSGVSCTRCGACGDEWLELVPWP